jgi:hypothetical protein
MFLDTSLCWQIHCAVGVCVYIIQRNVCLYGYFFICISAEVWSLFCALSRNAPLFLSAHTCPLQPEAVLVCHGALPNLQTTKRKLVTYFSWQTYCPHLEWPIPEYKVLKFGDNKLAYFKYTPVKAKIKTTANTHFCFVICNLDHTAILFLNY